MNLLTRAFAKRSSIFVYVEKLKKVQIFLDSETVFAVI